MFEREVMLVGVRRQKKLLEELVAALERKSPFDDLNFGYVDGILAAVESSLRRLRKTRVQNQGYFCAA